MPHTFVTPIFLKKKHTTQRKLKTFVRFSVFIYKVVARVAHLFKTLKKEKELVRQILLEKDFKKHKK